MAAFRDGNDPLSEFGLNEEGVEQFRVSNEKGRNPQIENLVKAWRTEVNCPEVLPYKEALVKYFINTLKDQEDRLEAKLDELDDENEESDDRANKMALHDIYSMDMERVKYSLARYLRVRILKIENIPSHVL